MSGRKQHFIPQSLLRGFGVQKAKKTYVVAYTYDRGIFSPPTDGIGAERSFYSELDVEGVTQTLDDKITDYEQRIPEVLEQLRDLSRDADAAVAAELVTHLTIRNDHFRKTASKGGTGIIEGMTEALTNEETAKVLMGVAGDRPSELFDAKLSELWAEIGPAFTTLGMTEAQFKALGFQAMKANFSSFHAEIVGPMGEAFAGMIDQIPELAANAQRSALDENLAPPARMARLVNFHWQTIEPDHALILPDCVAVVADKTSGTLPLMLGDLGTTDMVLMPLASDRLLVGSLEGGSGQPEKLNEVLAGCSWDFFVARERTPELEKLQSLLRTKVNTFLTTSVDEVIEESLAKN